MKKLMAFIRMALRSIKLGFAARPPHAWEVSLARDRQDERERAELGRRLLPKLSETARRRFSEEVLIKLLGNGWTEGRKADAEVLAEMQ